MAYTALYRKYRPLVFNEVVEQQHIVRSLKNSVKSGQIAHAYLFCGTRGTGKTSMAHILSRAINCLEPVDGSPCNKCKICSGILSGGIMDVLELDAASNNSVDNIRDIRDEVAYSPSHTRYKVYIIDEVHMLSAGAFNALLKTLEEPPSHVVFILATTEPHKLPATVLSRCQRYDFHRISVEGIMNMLLSVAKESGCSLDERAARLIAIKADGALRDALSILEQCISIGHESITLEDVLSVAGIVDHSFISSLSGKIINGDLKAAINMVTRFFMEGKDLRSFTSDLSGYFRNLLVYKMTGDLSLLAEVPVHALDTVKKQARDLSREHVTYIIKELSSLEASLRWALNPRILFEVSIIKLCESIVSGEKNLDLAERLSALERKVDKMSVSERKTKQSHSQQTAETNDYPQTAETNDYPHMTETGDCPQTAETSDCPHMTETGDCPQTAETSDCSHTAETNDRMQASENDSGVKLKPLDCWAEILDELKSSKRMVLYSCLLDTQAYIQGDRKVLIVDSSGGMVKTIVSGMENTRILEALLKEKLGENVKFIIESQTGVPNNGSSGSNESYENDLLEKAKSLAEKLNIPSLEVVDE